MNIVHRKRWPSYCFDIAWILSCMNSQFYGLSVVWTLSCTYSNCPWRWMHELKYFLFIFYFYKSFCIQQWSTNSIANVICEP